MEANKWKWVNIVTLSQYTGIPVRTLRTFVAARKIPFLRCGHRTMFFDPDKVDKALQRFEVRAIAQDGSSRNGTRVKRQTAQ